VANVECDVLEKSVERLVEESSCVKPVIGQLPITAIIGTYRRTAPIGQKDLKKYVKKQRSGLE
jgi:hypothetical protein